MPRVQVKLGTPRVQVSVEDGQLATTVVLGGPPGTPGEGVPAGGSAGQVLAKASGSDFDTEWSDAGPPGTPGEGVPAGGSAGQVLAKASGSDFDTEWSDADAGASAFDELTDVDVTGKVDGSVFVWDDDAGKYVPIPTAVLLQIVSGAALSMASGQTSFYGPDGASVSSPRSYVGALLDHARVHFDDGASLQVHIEQDGTGIEVYVADIDDNRYGTLAIAATGAITLTGPSVEVNGEPVVTTDDSRLSDARTPTAHASTHQDGGSDELALDGSQITTGTVAEARIDSAIARDTEVATAVANHAAASDPHGDRAYAAGLVDDLSGVTNASSARTALGLGTAATQASSAFDAAGTATSAVSTHAGASDPHGDRAYTTSAIGTHAAASDPHGDRAYTDTQLLAYLTSSAAPEVIRDTIGAALVAGANITLTVNDPSDTITIAVSGLTSAQVSDFTEAVQDVVGAYASGTGAITLTYNDSAGTLVVSIADASDTAKGAVELATAAETTTGTDNTRAVTPDGLAGSEYGIEVVEIPATDLSTALTTGDGKNGFIVPAKLNGWNLVRAHAGLLVAQSTSGLPTFQIRNATKAVDMLSTKVSIDANEWDSYSAATASVVDTAHDDVSTGDRIFVDCDVAGTGAKGVVVVLEFQAP